MTKKKVSSYHKLPIFDGLELLDAKNHTRNFPFHTHDTYNIALVLNTTLGTNIRGKLLNAPAGTLFVTNPEDVRATLCEPKIGNSFFTFYVSPELVENLNSNALAHFENRIIYDSDLFERFYFLSQRFKDPKVNFEVLFEAALQCLLFKHASDNFLRHKKIDLFESYIKEVDIETFSLDKTAKQFGLNKYKFIRLFKQETGLTPNHFMILKRIEKSKRLLDLGNTIADVAIATGFYDSAHFYRHFKKFMGVTPLAYQKA